ncbi:arginine--tRNA ligase [Granulicella tundricola]|uniref:arginine--tRNA ligase n=1 Tax=Granulicella tundricola (strain ATCC BAA-1859 / DSM 23138 / MP5ACTX9) TaxID=1198114 RepID=E8X1D8_GRATM|nr:DALR anticodon-binding domain-containing protein [Granulicella tundricola]ADW69092.1 Arginine--tRNA ligase [Granulicella tundricola MP5ACTX9]
MYRTIQQTLLGRIQALLSSKYEITLTQLAVEQPPSIALGELALPVAFELAKRLRKAPRAIAMELAEALNGDLASLPGVASVEVAGAGYLNVRLDRAAAVQSIAADRHADLGGAGFRLIEHTSINPNKAAHIGHLRNAILGDTFQRLLRKDEYKTGYDVGVQNYIDNTGVQVADVVVGFTELLGKDLKSVRELLTELIETNQRIDFYCWDLYARVSQWYTEAGVAAEELQRRKQVRLDTLHALEHGGNDIAVIADIVATDVLRRHLDTMQRLGIEYDFLPRESEILSLHFWDAARKLMIEKGVLYQETEGKNKGCWVMRRAGTDGATEDSGPDEEAKVIVRSNGTVTYVGKDIAYHLWKFGLLEKDFGYVKFHEYATHTCWISTGDMGASDPAHPVFAKADAIYNVIDSSQSDPQNNVIAALRGMGYTDAADRYTHFSYEKVALTPRCAVELGYTISDEDKARPFIEVSGRKGLGVKADDLLDKLTAAAKAELDTRRPELTEDERLVIAGQIAVGALRYFMLRFNRNTIIAFDFKDALSFEGETGPYVQYAIVRAANIFRKSGVTEREALAGLAGADKLTELLGGEEGGGIWETWLAVSRLTAVLDLAINSAEPAHLAKYVFQLAQQFNNFYHRFHILNEMDAERKALLLGTAAVAKREMIRALGFLGIEAPAVM